MVFLVLFQALSSNQNEFSIIKEKKVTYDQDWYNRIWVLGTEYR